MQSGIVMLLMNCTSKALLTLLKHMPILTPFISQGFFHSFSISNYFHTYACIRMNINDYSH